MLTNLFPTRTFDFYTDAENLFERFIPVENGTITIDVPGFTKNDLSLEIDANTGLLTVNGEKEINGRKREVKRTIKDHKLKNVDLDSVEAKVQDGILSIYIRELDAKVKDRKRQISVN